MRTSDNLSTHYDRPARIALIVGLAAAVLSVVGLLISGAGPFFQAYLFAYQFWLGISLGLLAILLLHFLVGSRWGLTIRRVAEAGAGSLWLLALLFIPILLGLNNLYPWARGELPATEANAFKIGYLSVPLFIIRAVIYFLAWILLAYFVNRNSARLAVNPASSAIRGRLQGLAAFGIIVYILTMTFASVDWMMSLEPLWTSTIYGLMMIVGQVLSALAFAVLVTHLVPSLTRGRTWTYQTTPLPFRDLGALLLTFIMGWAYLAFFQFLIMWAGNLPREVVWYLARSQGGWGVLAVIITVFLFALPFAILLSVRARHNLRVLAVLGALLLVVNLVNLFWHIKPAFSPGVLSISWLDIVLPIAIGGLWLFVFFTNLKSRPVLTEDEAASLRLAEMNEHPAAR